MTRRHKGTLSWSVFLCVERQIVMVRDVEASLLSAEETQGGKGLGQAGRVSADWFIAVVHCDIMIWPAK